MGREIRKVPKDWQHTRYHDNDNRFEPLLDEDYESACKHWWAEALDWHTEGTGNLDDRQEKMREKYKWYWESNGGPPDEEDGYRPAWTEDEATHFQMYETVSEGTPVSPVFATLQELEDWLVDVGYWEELDGLQCAARGLGPRLASPDNPGWYSQKCSREAARAFCKSQWAPSGVMIGGSQGGYYTGPEALAAIQKNEETNG